MLRAIASVPTRSDSHRFSSAWARSSGPWRRFRSVHTPTSAGEASRSFLSPLHCPSAMTRFSTALMPRTSPSNRREELVEERGGHGRAAWSSASSLVKFSMGVIGPYRVLGLRKAVRSGPSWCVTTEGDSSQGQGRPTQGDRLPSREAQIQRRLRLVCRINTHL